MNEVWRPVAGFEGIYEVSNLGRVKVRERRLNTWFGGRVAKERILKASPGSNGYPKVALSDATTGRSLRYESVHVLVATTFIGPSPSPLHEVCHNDGNKLNCATTNLRWDTKRGNMNDQYRHGTRRMGEVHPLAVFTDEQVSWIRASDSSGASIAKMLGVDITTVCRARRGATYASRSERR